MAKSTDVTFSTLDPSQKSAFRSIIDDDANLHIVFGPPGTGKSQLVVSLLERLAADNKRVLFVSQNTEALKVIERMVRLTEKDISYPTDNKYISLLDFCLMLYNPTHRYLKFLREQYTRLSGKQLPPISEIAEPDPIQYALRYTNLNHDQNFGVRDEVIGFDELVSYYMRYVNQVMAPEPLRSFEQVDVRAIFDALDGYKHAEYFREFNHPRRELVLLSTKNPNLSLPEVRSSLKDIKGEIAGDWTAQFPTKFPVDIVDYVNLLKEYISAIELLDVYKVATENIVPAELAQSLKSYINSSTDINARIERIDNHIKTLRERLPGELNGITHTSHKVQLNAATLTIAERSMEEVHADKKRILELTMDLLKRYPDIAYASIQDVWIGLAQAIKGFYDDSIQDESGFIGSLTAKNIDDLNNDLQAYDGKSSVKRMVSGIPNSFKELLHFTNAKDLEVYRESFQEILAALGEIIKVNGTTVRSVLEIGEKPASTPLDRIGVTLQTDIQKAKDAFMPVHELVSLLVKYSIPVNDFNTTRHQLKEFDASIMALSTLMHNPANKKVYIHSKLDAFIEAINVSVDVATNEQQRTELVDSLKDLEVESYRQNGQFFVNVPEASSFTARAQVVYDYLSHKSSSLSKLLDIIATPDNNLPIGADLDAIEKVLDRANLSDNFSDYFFEIPKGHTLADWLNSVTVLETYNNDAEVVDFVEHNKSINAVRSAMGIDNKKYIDDVLSNDITFDTFSARIVNAIVNECFGRAHMADKKHVTTKDVVDAYDAYLKNQKASVYREDLRHIYNQCLSATKELSKQSTLQLGGKSTMDKFRHSTHTIADAFPIICATPKDVSKYVVATKGIFDYVIFDEASQLLPGQAIPSIYRAKKAVVIGDPHQMPPSLNASFGVVEQSEDEFDDLGESILDLLLKQPQKQHHLKVHYRSRYNKLFEPSRDAIYSNDGIEPIFEAELASGAPIDIVDDLGDELDEHGYDKNFYKICESLNQYIEQDNKADFCVLFTTNQVLAKFKDFLAEVGERQFSSVASQYSTDKILLSTVTNCQGIEGAYTIIYMHHYSRPGAMWFFKESAGAYKRLNVAITRQREGLTLLLADQRSQWVRACDDKIGQSDTGPNTRKSAELMRTLLTRAGEQADTTYLDRKLGSNANWFDSPLTEQLYDKLMKYYSGRIGRDLKIYSEVGWNLVIPTGDGIEANERNVGFRIDLGVYSIPQRRFVLGIEMDGAMYHSGFDKEHSDYNRQKVLEEKGWRLYRIWSTNWLNDTQKEFDKLVDKINHELSIERAPRVSKVDALEPPSTPSEQPHDQQAELDDQDSGSSTTATLVSDPDPAPDPKEDTAVKHTFELDSYRDVVLERDSDRVVMTEMARIDGRPPIPRCQIVVHKDSLDGFAMMLMLAVASAQIHKELDTGTSRLVITNGHDYKNLIIGQMFGEETDFSPGNSFEVPRIVAQKLKDAMRPPVKAQTFKRAS